MAGDEGDEAAADSRTLRHVAGPAHRADEAARPDPREVAPLSTEARCKQSDLSDRCEVDPGSKSFDVLCRDRLYGYSAAVRDADRDGVPVDVATAAITVTQSGLTLPSRLPRVRLFARTSCRGSRTHGRTKRTGERSAPANELGAPANELGAPDPTGERAAHEIATTSPQQPQVSNGTRIAYSLLAVDGIQFAAAAQVQCVIRILGHP